MELEGRGLVKLLNALLTSDSILNLFSVVKMKSTELFLCSGHYGCENNVVSSDCVW